MGKAKFQYLSDARYSTIEMCEHISHIWQVACSVQLGQSILKTLTSVRLWTFKRQTKYETILCIRNWNQSLICSLHIFWSPEEPLKWNRRTGCNHKQLGMTPAASQLTLGLFIILQTPKIILTKMSKNFGIFSRKGLILFWINTIQTLFITNCVYKIRYIERSQN